MNLLLGIKDNKIVLWMQRKKMNYFPVQEIALASTALHLMYETDHNVSLLPTFFLAFFSLSLIFIIFLLLPIF